MSKSQAVKEIKANYPKLTARLKNGEIRVTERLTDQTRAEELAYYTDDAEDALGTAHLWLYQDQTCLTLGGF